MQYLVSGKEMKLLDQNTSTHFHVPELVLMEQAAMAFVRELFLIQKESDRTWKQAGIVCGSGNNGADGLAIARLLTQQKKKVTIFTVGEAAGHKTTASYEQQRKICSAYEIPIRDTLDTLEECDLIVDAVFGTGLSRKVEGALAETILQMNQAAGWKVSVDISSGLSADNGEVLGCGFRADDTITFSFGKIGQFLWPGNEYSGTVHITPIGITEESFLEHKPRTAVLKKQDLVRLPARMAHSNKGTYGKLLVIAGSVNMAGAACLCAQAAYRMGSGLVRVVTAEENRQIVQSAVPEAILTTYSKKIDTAEIIDAVKWADAVVIGPGIGTDRTARELLSCVMGCVNVPMVLDADALNILAEDVGRLLRPHMDLILTPHLGEMSRLTGASVSYLQTDLCGAAEQFAQTYDVICVLKDFHTITAVPYGMTYLNLSGNPGMATAGSGDVLSGVIGSLLAQGMQASLAAPYGVYTHGLAGDEAQASVGMRSMMAGDIAEGLKFIHWENEDEHI